MAAYDSPPRDAPYDTMATHQADLDDVMPDAGYDPATYDDRHHPRDVLPPTGPRNPQPWAYSNYPRDGPRYPHNDQYASTSTRTGYQNGNSGGRHEERGSRSRGGSAGYAIDTGRPAGPRGYRR